MTEKLKKVLWIYARQGIKTVFVFCLFAVGFRIGILIGRGTLAEHPAIEIIAVCFGIYYLGAVIYAFVDTSALFHELQGEDK